MTRRPASRPGPDGRPFLPAQQVDRRQETAVPPESQESGGTAAYESVVAGELAGDLVGLVLDLLGALLHRRGGLICLTLVLQILVTAGGTGRLLGASLELFGLVLELVLNPHGPLLESSTRIGHA